MRHKTNQIIAKITAIEICSVNIVTVTLAHPKAETFKFKPGQYAILTIDGHDSRPYSIASCPDQSEISFHVKDVGHGMSHALATAPNGMNVTIDLPHGSAVLQSHSPRPILAIGGGLGLAPLLPIIKTALKSNPKHTIHLYHGAETPRDLYLDKTLEDFAKPYENFVYTGISEIETPDHLNGIVGNIVADQLSDLAGFDAYIAGGPAMVVATVQKLEENGLDSDHVYTDAPL